MGCHHRIVPRLAGPLLTALVCAALPFAAPGATTAEPCGAAPPPPAQLPEADLAPGGSPPLPPPAESEPPQSVPASLLEEPNGAGFDAWFDVPHAFLERRIFGIVNGFDRFFADERDLGSLRSRSFVRLRQELRVGEDGGLQLGGNLRADLTLPYIRKRLKRFRIVLENAGRGLVDPEPRPLGGQEAGGRTEALLGFSLLDTIGSSIDLGAGVLFDLPPGLVTRARFRYAKDLGGLALGRVAVVGFWNTRDGFGTNGSGALERALPRGLLLRWTAGTLVSQVSHGFESASELALLARVGRDTAVTLLGSASGASKPILVVQTWRTAVRFRTSFLRRWLFGEIEPEVRWPRYDADGHRIVRSPGERRWESAVFLRVEIQFEEAGGA